MPISKIGSKGVKDAELTADDLAPGTITNAKLADATIENAKLAGSITNDKLANTSITINGTAIALGASGDIVAGTDWQSVVVADGSTATTAVAGEGYFIDTTSAAHTLNLPGSPSIGDTIAISDYAGTFGTNNVTIGRNGNKIQGNAADGLVNTSNQNVRFTYVDSTKGWIPTIDATAGSYGAQFTSATGGTVTTVDTNYKVHTFTSSGCFVVSQAGNSAGGGDKVSYLVVAGGAGSQEAGGGAGGFREGRVSTCSYTVSPLNAPDGIQITATTYPVTVGGGGTQGSSSSPRRGGDGSNSVFSTITSAGGGSGAAFVNGPCNIGGPGGSGGGAAGYPGRSDPGGTGNTPPVSPPQGSNGGPNNGGHPSFAGGGGGATAVGSTSSSSGGGPGGNGATTHITGSPVAYAGGGGGGGTANNPRPGGTGGGGAGGGSSPTAANGTANTGGGGGGTWCSQGKTGGSGIVVIRYKFQ